MPEVNVPDPAALRLDGLRLRSPAQRNRSLWTGASKAIGLAGAELWTGAVSVSDIGTEVDERQWRAFLWALGGPQNWFRAPLPCNQHAGTRPTVGSGANKGYTLPLAGMAVSQTILQAGQFITVPLPSGRFRAACLTAPLVSNGSGAGTASFRPALTEAPTFGVTVETLNPFLPASPNSDDLGISWNEGVGAIAFDIEENR
jgi:hypothetical protein